MLMIMLRYIESINLEYKLSAVELVSQDVFLGDFIVHYIILT